LAICWPSEPPRWLRFQFILLAEQLGQPGFEFGPWQVAGREAGIALVLQALVKGNAEVHEAGVSRLRFEHRKERILGLGESP
jgi:hypothetical protein